MSSDEGKLISKEDLLTLPTARSWPSSGRTIEGGISSEERPRPGWRPYGPNEVRRRKRSGPVRFLSYFRNPLVLILLFAGTITLFTGEPVSAVVIYTIVAFSTVLTYAQEIPGGEGLRQLLSRGSQTTATVVRGGS